MERNDKFNDISPDVGELNEQAFADALAEGADEALELLADMTGATDVKLRELARNMAGRLVLDLARSGPPRARGVGRIRHASAAKAVGDLDVDRSLDALIDARAGGRAPDLDDLVVRAWQRPDTALCLIIDRSGSMGGDRLATAGIAAAACAWRAPADHSVLAFSDHVIVIKDQDVSRQPETVVDDVFCLRGHGPTDLDMALRIAREQLGRSRAKRRLTILLSDCRVTSGKAALDAARSLDELCIIAPADDSEDAEELARITGATFASLTGPSDIPAAFAALLEF